MLIKWHMNMNWNISSKLNATPTQSNVIATCELFNIVSIVVLKESSMLSNALPLFIF